MGAILRRAGRATLALAAVLATALPAARAARAQPAAWTPPATASGDHVVRAFRFATGEVLPEVRLHWRTLGRPQRDARGVVRNAVLVLHGTGGSGAQFLGAGFAAELYGPGQPLDTARHYVILPDNVGHGQSSKPSDGLRARFPRYGYADMVELQRRLLVDGLGVTHLRLIFGTSMGCMHAWMWGTTHPGFADALAPFACLPTQIAGRNRMLRTLAMDAIRTDPGWNGGNYATQPRGLDLALGMLFVMGSAPLVQQAQAPTREAADSVIRAWMAARRATTDANDFLYQFDASRDYDPSPHLARVTVPVLHVNSADDEVNPPELGLLERLVGRMPNVRAIVLPTGPTLCGHGTHTAAVVWKRELARLLEDLPPVPTM